MCTDIHVLIFITNKWLDQTVIFSPPLTHTHTDLTADTNGWHHIPAFDDPPPNYNSSAVAKCVIIAVISLVLHCVNWAEKPMHEIGFIIMLILSRCV